jgi:hypothetical protein
MVAVQAPREAVADDDVTAVDPLPAKSVVPAEELRLVPADPWATFVYERPAPVYRLRLGLEQLGIVAVGMTGYLIHAPEPSCPGIAAPTIGEKLTFAQGSWYLDPDAITVNFASHPTAGTFYYMFARSNRVPIWEAFLWAIGSSTVWELIEYKEPVSINDMVVTPTAGLAIGEGFTQLSGWFDRDEDNSLNQAFAWILDPMKKIHDWIDGAKPRRDSAYRGWHEFSADAAAGLLWQNGVAYAALGFDLRTRLFRVPGYGESGGTGYGFSDGNVSAMGLSATYAAGLAVDFLFETETAVAGFYARDLRTESETLTGWDVFAGLTSAFEYGSHVWNLPEHGPKNQITLVRIPGVDARVRIFSGSLELDCSLDVAFDMGGVEPLGNATVAALSPGQVFPTVYSYQGYYFGIGLHLAPGLELRYGPAALGASVRTDWLWGLTDPCVPQLDGQVVSLHDTRTTAAAWLRFRMSAPSLEFALRGNWRDRSGEVEGQKLSQQERSLLATIAVVF